MNEIQVFKSPMGMDIRTVMIGSEPWFVAADVCKILGLENTTKAMLALDAEQFTLRTVHGQLRNKPVNMVNESGLYDLIFLSRKPEAKAFRKWVTSEVLPAIRKTGMYATESKTLSLVEQLQTPEGIDALLSEFRGAKRQLAEQAPVVAAFNEAWKEGDSATLTEFFRLLTGQAVGPRKVGELTESIFIQNNILCRSASGLHPTKGFTEYFESRASGRDGKIYTYQARVKSAYRDKLLQLVKDLV
jgi:prophage antirepressor-like protein